MRIESKNPLSMNNYLEREIALKFCTLAFSLVRGTFYVERSKFFHFRTYSVFYELFSITVKDNLGA